MSQVNRLVSMSALIVGLFVWNQPYSRQPFSTSTPIAQTRGLGNVQLAGTDSATTTPPASITPSPMPELGTGQTSGRATYHVVILILALGVVSWVILRRAGPMSGSNLLGIVVGFLGWFVINTLLWVWILETDNGAVFLNPFKLIPLCLNVPALLLLSLRGRWILVGVLAAILVNSIGTLLFVAPGPIEDDRLFDIIGMTPFFLSFLRLTSGGALSLIWMVCPLRGIFAAPAGGCIQERIRKVIIEAIVKIIDHREELVHVR